jgi:hypothetical protein
MVGETSDFTTPGHQTVGEATSVFAAPGHQTAGPATFAGSLGIPTDVPEPEPSSETAVAVPTAESEAARTMAATVVTCAGRR